MKRSQEILAAFGARIRELRKEHGFSQEGFADHCGLDRTYLGGIERGQRNVSLMNIEIIAKGLDLSIAELMCGLGPTSQQG